MNTEAMFSSRSDNWETPQYLFDVLNAKYHFDLDVCASKENAKCPRYYSIKDNGLVQEWGGVLLDESSIWTYYWTMGSKGI